MAMLNISRATLPVTVRGNKGTISVAVRENGQIGFSTSAGELFKGFTHALIDWDTDNRVMVFKPVNLDKLPKGVTAEATFIVGQSKDESRYISAAGLFKHDAIAYDYKACGTHSFPGHIDTDKSGSKLSFTLPTAMVPKPKVARKPKADKTATIAAPVATDSDDLEDAA